MKFFSFVCSVANNILIWDIGDIITIYYHKYQAGIQKLSRKFNIVIYHFCAGFIWISLSKSQRNDVIFVVVFLLFDCLAITSGRSYFFYFDMPSFFSFYQWITTNNRLIVFAHDFLVLKKKAGYIKYIITFFTTNR